MTQVLEQIGSYTILRRLGKGGMGSVYQVRPSESDNVYALKILDPFEIMEDIIGIPGLQKIFRAEADIMRTLNDSSVVKVHDSGEDHHGRPYFVMEFFCRNLGEMLGEGFWMDQMSRVIPPAATLNTIRQLLQGLSVLHRQRIVHRDIKPFNLLVSDDNQLKICDFGMALHNGKSPVSGASMIVGSPFYAAPEQNRQSAELDGCADLYSAAVIMFRMLTGVFPSAKHFPLSRFNPALSPTWDLYLQKGLQRKPETGLLTVQRCSPDWMYCSRNLNKVLSPTTGPDLRRVTAR